MEREEEEEVWESPSKVSRSMPLQNLSRLPMIDLRVLQQMEDWKGPVSCIRSGGILFWASLTTTSLSPALSQTATTGDRVFLHVSHRS